MDSKHMETSCDTMCSNSAPFVLALLRRSLCLFWCETHTKRLRTRSSARPEVKAGRKVREKTERVSRQRRAKETSRLEIAVQRMRQSAEGGNENMEVGQRREPTEVKKMTAKTCWPTEAGLTNAKRCQHR